MKLRNNLNQIKPYIAGKLKEGAIKLASNENPLGPSPMAMRAVRRQLKNVYLYPDAGCEVLKAGIAAKYEVDKDMLIVGNGSDEILLFIAGAYIEPGANSVTSEITFSEYTFATSLFGGETRYAKMTDYRYDLKAIGSLIDSGTRIVFIANPNNPTGTYLTDRELREFMSAVPQDTLVVLDEAYAEFVEAKDYPDSISMVRDRENLLVLRTFSKMYGLAGLRVGYGIGSRKVISDLHKTKEPFNVNSLAQVAARAALEDAAHVKKSFTTNSEGKKYFYRELDALGITYCRTEANFVYMKIGMDADKAFRTIMDRGMTIRPMGSDAIRVTIGTRSQNELFFRLFRQLLAEEGKRPG